MRGFPFALILIAILTGCGNKSGGNGNSGTSAASPKADTQKVSVPQVPSETGEWVDWTPANVELNCEQGADCPAQVGLLIFVDPPVNGKHDTHRCTAFMISSGQVMSNGHCDRSKNATGYFVTAMTAPGGRQLRKVTTVQSKLFTPSNDPQQPDLDSGRPDVAVFNLDQPIHLPGLELAGLNDPPYTKLNGYVINGAKEKYTIHKIVCDFRRHEAIFPFNFNENPDVVSVFNCSVRKGNSGGPMFAAGSAKVQSVVQAYLNPQDRPSPLNYENHWRATATNVRCLDAPANSCTQATREAKHARFKALQERASQQRPGQPLRFNEWAEILP